MKKVKKIRSFLPSRDHHKQQHLGGCPEKAALAAQDSSGAQEFLQKWDQRQGEVFEKVVRSVARKNSCRKSSCKSDQIRDKEKFLQEKFLRKCSDQCQGKPTQVKAKSVILSAAITCQRISSINNNRKPSISRISEEHFFWRVIFLNQHPQGIRQLCKFLTSRNGPLKLSFFFLIKGIQEIRIR